jgi:hypothetical protein
MIFEIAVLVIALVGLATWIYDKRHSYMDGRSMISAPPPRKYPKPKMQYNKEISNKRWWG